MEVCALSQILEPPRDGRFLHAQEGRDLFLQPSALGIALLLEKGYEHQQQLAPAFLFALGFNVPDNIEGEQITCKRCLLVPDFPDRFLHNSL